MREGSGLPGKGSPGAGPAAGHSGLAGKWHQLLRWRGKCEIP